MSSLSIIIPAFNEEEAIARTVARCIAERSSMIHQLNLSNVEIIVVDDGSSDRTGEIVGREFPDVRLIQHPVNRGYGAAIKTGFEEAQGDIVGFLDADGTCDPKYFVDLCSTLQQKNADVVLGSRMARGNKMPMVRRIGNTVYALLATLLAGRIVNDTASGMRVVRRESLKKLYPLPDGMHFTPAMSCKALLDEGLTIYEVAMSYAEREGRSKLNVFKDGIIFFKTIFDIALTYRPGRLFGVAGTLIFAAGALYVIFPLKYYLLHLRLEEWMIYRLISVVVFCSAGLSLISIGETAENFLALAGYRQRKRGLWGNLAARIFKPTILLFAGLVAMIAAVFLNVKTIRQYVSTGHITVHWSYVLAGGALILVGLNLIALAVLGHFAQLLRPKPADPDH
jgi:glycosyltransferase involved in cell wall biosynthesis